MKLIAQVKLLPNIVQRVALRRTLEVAKGADAYKLDRKAPRRFRPISGIAFDDRILRWKLAESRVSIWTVDGRMWVPFVCGPRQRVLLANRLGETDLIQTGK